MQAMMSQPPPSAPPPGPPPGPPPSSGQGHGAFSEEEIQQMMADTGMNYEQVCAAIDQTGGTSKEQVFPNIYSGQGIQPEAAPAETVAPGAVQGQPPPAPGPEGTMPPDAVSMAAAPAEPEGISPEVAQAMHDELSPMAKYRRRR